MLIWCLQINIIIQSKFSVVKYSSLDPHITISVYKSKGWGPLSAWMCFQDPWRLPCPQNASVEDIALQIQCQPLKPFKFRIGLNFDEHGWTSKKTLKKKQKATVRLKGPETPPDHTKQPHHSIHCNGLFPCRRIKKIETPSWIFMKGILIFEIYPPVYFPRLNLDSTFTWSPNTHSICIYIYIIYLCLYKCFCNIYDFAKTTIFNR